MKSKVDKSLLSELTIRSLGVIESAEVEFGKGFTVITGETGAGKTMVLTALNLILGAKSDADFVRTGDERLVVSGKFRLGSELIGVIEEAGAFAEDGEVIISRSVTNQGKSKISLGGVVSTTTQVAEIAQDLIEIHAQSSSARLSKASVQRELLDSFGEYPGEITQYATKYSEYVMLQKRISDLEKQLAVREKEISRLEVLVKDFEKVLPKSGELLLLDDEINKLGSVEELNTGIIAGLGAISGEDSSAISSLVQTKKILESLRGKDSELDGLIDQFSELVYGIGEANSALERYLARLEADPARFDQLQVRKSELLTFLKKHGSNLERDLAFEELIIQSLDSSSKLVDLRGGDSKLLELKLESDSIFKALRLAGEKLTAVRLQAAINLSSAITGELGLLAMPNAKLSVEISTLSWEVPSNYTSSGLDEVQFLFTSHKDGKLLPLSKAASGGELSRVMLAIEVVLAKSSPVGTYIFDEVDAGVGGKAAIEVGRRLALLAMSSQVIVVTHLAQVASWADNHLVVSKSESGSITQSNVLEVLGEDRRKEIARLLSGQDESKSAQEHAGELLEMVASARMEMIG